jgi:hypothetical protein
MQGLMPFDSCELASLTAKNDVHGASRPGNFLPGFCFTNPSFPAEIIELYNQKL